MKKLDLVYSDLHSNRKITKKYESTVHLKIRD